MKTFFKFSALVLTIASALCISSCNSMTEPEKVTDKTMKCFMKNDIPGMLETYKVAEREKEQFIALYEKAVAAPVKEKGGVKKYSILGSTINEDSGIATVKVHLIYGDGTESDVDFNLINEDGEWLQIPTK